MRRLTLRQILVAIAVGALFAALQGDAPVAALQALAAPGCSALQTHC
jgi:hypothetical protein